MVITSAINIDMQYKYVNTYVDAVQYDVNSRNVEITLLKAGSRADIPTGSTFEVKFKRPDGSSGSYSELSNGQAAVTKKETNVIVVWLSEFILSEAGATVVSVCVKDGETEVNTFSFIVNVQESPHIGTGLARMYPNTYDATATPSDIANGKTAYVKGEKILGTSSQVGGGNDGFSPNATVTQTADGAVISITDKSGTTTATVTNGEDGITPRIGSNGNWFLGEEDTGNPSRGERGNRGNPGMSASHTWDGSVLTITSASGISSADLKGPKGDSVGIKSITENTESGGTSRINFTDGHALAIKNGTDGQPGEKGDPGNPGTSVRHTWDGSVLTITSGVPGPVELQSSSVDLKGPKGDSVGIKSVHESTEYGGSNRITFTDGNMIAVKNGKSAYQYAQDGGFTGTEEDFSAKLAVPFLTPEQYGAAGDGETDDSAAIQAALDDAGSVSVVYLGAKKYKIETGLILTGTYKTLICDGWLVYSGEDVAITVKNAYRCKMNISTIDAANGTALKLDATEGAVYSNDFTVDVIRNCNIGIHLYTNGSHVSHNTLRNTYMSAKECGVRAWADSYYINENLWYLDWIDGDWQYGIHLHSDSTLSNISGFGVNDNKFYSGSLEGRNRESIPLLIDQSWGNYFKELRLAEGYGSTSMKIMGKCVRNDISVNHLVLSEIDISELGSGSVHNVLRCRGTNSDDTNFFIVGDETRVSAAHGFTYIPDRYNYNVNVNADTFAENIIGHVGTVIPTAVTFRSETTDGATFVVGGIYSDHGSMARGFPLSVRFGDGVGHVLLNDNKGNRIIDNRTGKYDGKVLSVRWSGFHNGLNQNIWTVQEIGGSVGAVDVTNLSQNVGFASDNYGVVLESAGGNKYRIVSRDDGLLTTVAAADVNQVPMSTDTDGSIFNGTGYQNGKRISSGGEVKEATNGTASGFMSVKAGAGVRFSGGRWETSITTNCVSYFASDKKTVVGYFVSNGTYGGIFTAPGVVTVLDNGMYQTTVPDNENIAYMRLSMYGPNGAPGENLVVYVDGEKEQTPIVESVNGKTGAVVLGASDVGALPASTAIPSKTSQLINDSGFITGYTETDPTVPAWAKAANKPSYSKSEVGLGNVENVKQYSASNPPPYPVTSVNGKTGAITLDASAVGARPSTWTPSASDVGALASANYTTKALTVTFEDGTTETVTLVVSK